MTEGRLMGDLRGSPQLNQGLSLSCHLGHRPVGTQHGGRNQAFNLKFHLLKEHGFKRWLNLVIRRSRCTNVTST